ncbi:MULTISPECIES: M56 family metallopeptidase [Streptomyces]|uniref:M56 family metallopeptidase n=1 Tax=Streptomyces TaxID=1883 RepID=UPI0022B05417|nr:M56 family metallopeptidase [Streptomyces sp. H39-C1]MCZ4103468.1 M56 family metallopeptidase [Streptomyces sp. H39-C1]
MLSPRLAHRLPPRAASWSLLCAAVVAVAGWAGTLALLTFIGFGQIPLVAFFGQWSTTVLHAQDPLPVTVAAVSGAVLAVMTIALGLASWWRGRVLVQAYQECHRMPGDTELAVIDDARLEAFALPGLSRPGGRIVVSTGMLQTVGPTEREALMAHERAHLRHQHHFFLVTLQLASAACPLLRPLAAEGAFTVERWADEDAALAVGDRTVVARALARAALAKKNTSPPSAALLAATGGPVPRRVKDLLAPPPGRRRMPLVVFALLLALCCTSLAEAAHDTEKLFEHAIHADTTAAPVNPRTW